MAYADDKIYGVVPQQAVHVADFKSYNDMHQGKNLTNLSHHPVCETLTDVNTKKENFFFRGILPDNADVVKSNHPRFNDDKHAISLQVAGLCSACVDIGDRRPESLVMGMPVCFDEGTKKIIIDTTTRARHEGQIGKFIDYVDDWHDSSIHAIICLYPSLNDGDAFTQGNIFKLQKDESTPELQARYTLLDIRSNVSIGKYMVSNGLGTISKRRIEETNNVLNVIINDKNVTKETRERAQRLLNENYEIYDDVDSSDEDDEGESSDF